MRTINPARTFFLDAREVNTNVTYSIAVEGPQSARIVPHTRRYRELVVDELTVRFADKDGEHITTTVTCSGKLLHIGGEAAQSYWYSADGRRDMKDMPDWVYEVIEGAIDADVLAKAHWPHRVI